MTEAALVVAMVARAFEIRLLPGYPNKIEPNEKVGVQAVGSNIHHSFPPAFVGAGAHERGVKTIGATAHYVTEDLDAGPIIHQDVTHRYTVDDLVRIGREVERRVLARAVRWHLQDRVLVDGNRTIVFE